jgi:hypothetical protein
MILFPLILACATTALTDTTIPPESIAPEVYSCVDHRAEAELYAAGRYPIVLDCGETVCVPVATWQIRVDTDLVVIPCDYDSVEIRWL